MMAIGELARHFDLRASALRFYERAGLLDPPARRAGKRVYDDVAARRVAFIRASQLRGFSLAEIKSLIRDGRSGVAPRQLWRKAAEQKLALMDRKIAQLRASRAALARMRTCRCRTFAQCEESAREKFGGRSQQTR